MHRSSKNIVANYFNESSREPWPPIIIVSLEKPISGGVGGEKRLRVKVYKKQRRDCRYEGAPQNGHSTYAH
jgi:hypothetical protein